MLTVGGNRMRERTNVWLPGMLALLFLAGCTSTGVSNTPPNDVDLSGSWLLNQSLSADTQGAIAHAVAQGREARIGAAQGRGGMRGGKGGGRREGGKGRNRSIDQAPTPRERLDVLVAELSPSAEQVVIEQTAAELIVSYGTQWEYRHLFGEKVAVSVAGYDGERRSGWQDQQFIVETKTESGSKVTERFTVDPDDKQLQIVLTLESKRLPDPITVTRVYDRARDPTETTASGP